VTYRKRFFLSGGFSSPSPVLTDKEKLKPIFLIQNMRPETRIIHAVPVDELTGAISTPIYQTSTYVQSSPGVNAGFDYSRTNNPTRKVLEDLGAAIENGTHGFAFASGLAAVDAVTKALIACTRRCMRSSGYRSAMWILLTRSR
jgi:cystathionine beta-lyase/cystathionine gamma-synthase